MDLPHQFLRLKISKLPSWCSLETLHCLWLSLLSFYFTYLSLFFDEVTEINFVLTNPNANHVDLRRCNWDYDACWSEVLKSGYCSENLLQHIASAVGWTEPLPQRAVWRWKAVGVLFSDFIFILFHRYTHHLTLTLILEAHLVLWTGCHCFTTTC